MWYRVTQVRSTIGLPKKLRNTALAMGLKKRGNVVYQKVNAANAGQILTLKELVDVQLVDQALTREEERLLRRNPKGYSVEASA
ncbi:54S ribosomal protein L33, mitochondrial [Wickerhamiella sorbophila]|uniref:Large ribosomal subunit protein uL30m n=1 Tax=Wickerhamiella sorbophila TaxID=45607 RepID=A0A2T0FKA8_9ASCO|nr:54S ribosomal protein L33, mitochondrial [Wickerhamiella sorbophila]PRT55420.1 54S ribosomal protein L33, mitochondrial [Wickerhamiella sorbophila]